MDGAVINILFGISVQTWSYYIKFHISVINDTLYGWISHYKEFKILGGEWINDTRGRFIFCAFQQIFSQERIRGGDVRADHVALIKYIKNAYKILVKKTERKRPFWRSGYKWANNIKMDPKYCERFWTWVNLSQNRNQ